MKKILCTLLAALFLCSLAAAETLDAVTTASVANYYGGLDGDELMNAVASYSGFYAVASVNPDGTPNIGFFIYSMVKLNDVYYLQLGLSPNQTTANVDNGSALIAMYAALPAEGATYPTTGAKMLLEKVEDEAILAELAQFSPEGYSPLYYQVTEVRPLG